MKITFTDQQAIAQEISGLTDATSLTTFKRDINIGGTMFLSALGREYNRHSRYADIVADQQYYQLPEDGHKLKEVVVNNGGWLQPLEQIPDEHAWLALNMTTTTGQTNYYFLRGYDEIGLYPIPTDDVTNGIELIFSPRHIELTQDDVTSTTSSTTVTVTNGDQTITNSGTSFTAKMTNQWFQVTDGTDSNWYKISSYTSSSSMELENYYQGTSGASKTFRIGQVMDLPEEFLEGPVDYAMYRHFLRRGDAQKAGTFKTLFESSLDQAKDNYGQTTDSQVINATPEMRAYNNWRGDPPASITAF